MSVNISNTTQALTDALKDTQRLDAEESKKKEKEPVVQALGRAVAVSISRDVKMQILKDSLN